MTDYDEICVNKSAFLSALIPRGPDALFEKGIRHAVECLLYAEDCDRAYKSGEAI